jgi:hypothetical protein
MCAKTSGLSTVPKTNVIGNIGVSPITAAAMTGFAMDLDVVGGQFALSAQLSGHAHGASNVGVVAADLRLDLDALRLHQRMGCPGCQL